MSSGFVLKPQRGFLDVPFSSQVPRIFGVLVACGVCVWANSKFFTPPSSASLEFQAEAARIGNVMTRTEAPPVFLNPISNRIPGNILGPDDLP